MNEPAAGTSRTAGPASPASSPPRLLGKYRVIQPLGEGGMGSVFLAEDTRLGRLAAVKIPQPGRDGDTEALARFYREARSAAALSHPAICPIYDFGESEGTPFLAMAYLRGRLLSQKLAAGALPEREAAGIVRTLAEALAYAHRQGVIHRDLKPQNVMLEEDGRPIILDFGLARQTLTSGETVTQSGVVMGTPAYISPEQAEGRSRAIGPACDIYSLGVMFYEMLTGQRPFQGSAAELLGKHLYKTPSSPQTVRPGVDAQLSELCMKMLAKAAHERPGSMAEIVDCLDRWIVEREAMVSAEDAAGRISWWAPVGLLGSGASLLYYAFWFASPGDDWFTALFNVGPMLLGGLGIALWCVAGWLVWKRLHRGSPRLRRRKGR